MVKKKKNPHNWLTLWNYMSNKCQILHTEPKTESPREACFMKLINEEEKVWISMSEPGKNKRNNKYSVQVNAINSTFKNNNDWTYGQMFPW